MSTSPISTPSKRRTSSKQSTASHLDSALKAANKHASSINKRTSRKQASSLHKALSQEQHHWDLRALFASEAACKNFLTTTQKQAKAFEKRYRARLASLTEKHFSNALLQYEQLIERVMRVMTYAFLTFAQDTTKGNIYAQYEMKSNDIQRLLVFFELEFCALESSKQKAFIKHVKTHSFYLQSLIKTKPYQLSLSAEQALIATSSVGVSAFARLFDEHLSALKIGKNKQSEEEVLAQLHSPKRAIRKQAQKAFTKSLYKSSALLSYILNMVRKDVAITATLRNYPSREAPRHISNHITQKSVDSMIDITNKSMPLVQHYYHAKAQLMGKKLKDYDRYAPLFSQHTNISYQQAMELVVITYNNFSPTFGAIVKRALQEGWVSSHPTPNKRGGAFSHGSVPSSHPYVLLNWTGNRRDTFTIAHEFGHMIHQELSKHVGVLNHDTPLTTAETASVFGEMLLFDYLKTQLSTKELLPIYAGKLEDIFSTLFRQVVMTNFERAIHSVDNELSVDDFDRIWQQENEKMFGDSIKLTRNYARWWSYIPHFIHSPFYCYAYSYGQLLVLALFGLYKHNRCENFIDKYTAFLAAGGSKAPSELVKTFGLDIESESFWEIGMQEVRAMLEEFHTLLASSGYHIASAV